MQRTWLSFTRSSAVQRNYAGQNAIDVRKTEELHMLSSELPIAVVVFNPSATPTMRIEKIGIAAKSARCEEREP